VDAGKLKYVRDVRGVRIICRWVNSAGQTFHAPARQETKADPYPSRSSADCMRTLATRSRCSSACCFFNLLLPIPTLSLPPRADSSPADIDSPRRSRIILPALVAGLCFELGVPTDEIGTRVIGKSLHVARAREDAGRGPMISAAVRPRGEAVVRA
jgi:hypothetical protein